MLIKLNIPVWVLRKLLVERQQSANRLVWQQCVKKITRPMCGQYFRSTQSSLNLLYVGYMVLMSVLVTYPFLAWGAEYYGKHICLSVYLSTHISRNPHF